MQPKAYSYLRFSTPEQMQGDSFRRQAALADDYARRHGLSLDKELTFRDLGVSAFRGRNAETGRLGDFLRAVDDGLVPEGAYLLVESLDRISRQAARKAFRILEDIADRGVVVVTLNDGRAYTKDSLDSDPTSLLIAILTFMRANEESETKARRLREAWKGKRLRASDKPLTRVTPAWIILNEDTNTLALIPERAKVVARIFDMLANGVGQHRIAETLNREGVPTFGRSTRGPKADYWHRSYIAKIAENPAAIGTFVPHVMTHEGGRKKRQPLDPVPGYYPAVVDAETFNRVQAQRETGRAPIVRGEAATVKSVLAGLARCSECGGSMTRVNKGVGNGMPRLVCAKAKAGAGCQYVSIHQHLVEDALLQNLPWLAATVPSGNTDLDAELASLEASLDATGDSIERIVDAIARGTSSPALMARLQDLEAGRDELKVQIEALTVQAATAASEAIANRIQEAADASEEPERDVARINAALRQSFNGVVIDHRSGSLRVQWKHGGESYLTFAMPAEQ